jgi:hypothetical protein
MEQLAELGGGALRLVQEQQHLAPIRIGNRAKDIRCVEWSAHEHDFTKT